MRKRWSAVITAVLLLAGTVGATRVQAQNSSPLSTQAGTVVPLWPGRAPDAVGNGEDDKPTLTVFLPANNPTRAGVVIAPGGGYQHLAFKKEGEDIAHWLNERGVAAFVLKYRLGPVYHHPVELGDARRAVRLARAHAAEYGIDPTRVGMWGFSAGGHLAATAGTLDEPGTPSSTDAVERESSRPSFLVLAYPVITMTEPSAHTSSRKYLLGTDPDPKLIDLLSAEKQVTADTPPTFLFATTDDSAVPVMNSVLFYSALVAHKVPAEIHLFQHGPHGVGLAGGFPDLKTWPDLLATWMRARGYMGPA